MRRRVLVVEDDRDLSKLLALHLADIECDVEPCDDGARAVEMAAAARYDLVILDIMLPGLDGITVCQRLRERQDYTPILMLTAKSTELDRVLGLEVGADDYLTKPFSIRELLARVRALFRRVDALASAGPAEAPPASIAIGPLEIEAAARRVRVDGEVVELTAREFDLLMHFARNPGRVYTRAELLDKVWGYTHSGYEHTVSSHINRLRAKIERDPTRPSLVRTVWGVGYRFAERGELGEAG